mmetsp:Transcript_32546/g.79193  ORF Transcript_32546/g.79193 Transcript_32546/m.79193 type:complete len:1147 (+) Transcript_32546:158-3598(+)
MIECSLQEYLGALVMQGQFLFAEKMNKFVKDKLKNTSTDLNQSKDEMERLKNELKKKKEDANTELQDLENSRSRLKNQLKEVKKELDAQDADPKQSVDEKRKGLEEEGKSIKKKIKNVNENRGQLQKRMKAIQNRKKSIIPKLTMSPPKWIAKARQAVGSSMKAFLNDDGKLWDVYTLVRIILFHGRSVFHDENGDEEDSDILGKVKMAAVRQVEACRNNLAHGEPPTEFESCDTLHHLQRVLHIFKFSEEAQKVLHILKKAQELVDTAARTMSGEQSIHEVTHSKDFAERLSKDFPERLWLYRELLIFEKKLKNMAGDFKYRGGTITFTEVHKKDILDQQMENFTFIAKARHWLHHHTSANINVPEVVKTMEQVLQNLSGIQNGTLSPQESPSGIVSIKMTLSARRMAIPVPSLQSNFVGRERELKQVLENLEKEGARVLIHGGAGVGKDTLATQAVCQKSIKGILGVQAWLQASTDDLFERQLVDWFCSNRRDILGDILRKQELNHEQKLEPMLKEIRHWLQDTKESWFFVIEDIPSSSKAVFKWIPRCTTDGGPIGRVLATSLSKDPGQKSYFPEKTRVSLEPFNTEDSMQLWMVQNEKHAAEDRKKDSNHEALLKTFFEEKLGGLPLAISLSASTWRLERSNFAEGIKDMIQLYEEETPNTIFHKFRNAQHDRHFHGIYGSVRISLRRLRKDIRYKENQRDNAIWVLRALSVLSRDATPLEFLHLLLGKDSDDEDEYVDQKLNTGYCAAPRTKRNCMSEEEIEHAISILRDRSLLSASNRRSVVGVVHPRIQECLLYSLVQKEQSETSVVRNQSETSAVPNFLRHIGQALNSQFIYDVSDHTTWRQSRMLASCAERFVDAVIFFQPASSKEGKQGEANDTTLDPTQEMIGVTGVHIASRLASMAFEQCKLKRAEDLYKRCLARLETLFRKDGVTDVPLFSSLLVRLAQVFASKGEVEEEAKTLCKKAVNMCKELDTNDLDLANALNALANVQMLIGEHNDAEVLYKKILKICRALYSRDHPACAPALSNLACLLAKKREFKKAFELHRQCLETFWKLGMDLEVANSMGNLADALKGRERQMSRRGRTSSQGVFEDASNFLSETRGNEPRRCGNLVRQLGNTVKNKGRAQKGRGSLQKVSENA